MSVLIGIYCLAADSANLLSAAVHMLANHGAEMLGVPQPVCVMDATVNKQRLLQHSNTVGAALLRLYFIVHKEGGKVHNEEKVHSNNST